MEVYSMILFVYILFTFGLANILVYAYGPFGIINLVRGILDDIFGERGNMLNCMMCVGANIGIVMSLLNCFVFTTSYFTPGNLLFGYDFPWYMILIVDMFFTSGTTWLLNSVDEYLTRIKS